MGFALGTVRAQSVLWLYCWAKTGMNSEAARQVAAGTALCPDRYQI